MGVGKPFNTLHFCSLFYMNSFSFIVYTVIFGMRLKLSWRLLIITNPRIPGNEMKKYITAVNEITLVFHYPKKKIDALFINLSNRFWHEAA